MTVNTMRLIDRYAGILLCWIAGIPRLLSRRIIPPPPPTLKRVLIIKCFGLGSIILAIPAISVLKSAFPSVKIDFLTFDSNRSLLERYPIIDRVIGIRNGSPSRFVGDTFDALRLLRKETYDAVFDFEFFSKYSTLLGSLVRSARRVGFDLPAFWRTVHLTDKVALSKKDHVSRAFCEQVYIFTGRVAPPPPQPPSLVDEDGRASGRMLPLKKHRRIAVNINAGPTFPERAWPRGRFVELLKNLQSTEEAEFVLIGSPDDAPAVGDFTRALPPGITAVDVSGKLTIPELAALFLTCDLLVSCDSGPVHLASSLGIPVVALYGPETPAFYGPVADGSAVLYKGISCSPCMNVYAAKAFRCPYNAECMRSISVAEVEFEVKEACVI